MNPIHVILLCLFSVMWMYSVFGGADFGMGIVESILVKRSKNPRAIQHLTKSVLGPVWEANHVWLIIAIVVLFIAFPKGFAMICIHLHLPLFLILLGIVVRGTAFSFRHYDPIEDASHKVHDVMFRLSSWITPFLFGLTLAALTRPFPVGASYAETYVWPFLSPISILSGLLFIALWTLTAWVLLLNDPKSQSLRQDVAAPKWMIKFPWMSRLTIAAIHAVIIASFIGSNFPIIIQVGQDTFSWYTTATSPHVLWILLITLGVGLILIIPNLIYLLKVFSKLSTLDN